MELSLDVGSVPWRAFSNTGPLPMLSPPVSRVSSCCRTQLLRVLFAGMGAIQLCFRPHHCELKKGLFFLSCPARGILVVAFGRASSPHFTGAAEGGLRTLILDSSLKQAFFKKLLIRG